MTIVAPMGEIGSFRFWCQKILPAVYDDSLSYYELLCKVIQKLNEIIEVDNQQSEAIRQIIIKLEELQSLFEQFMEHGFDDYYKNQIEQWIHDNMFNILSKIIQNGVYFELTMDGYFAANVFKSWAHVWFDTVMNYNDENYGCLELYY